MIWDNIPGKEVMVNLVLYAGIQIFVMVMVGVIYLDIFQQHIMLMELKVISLIVQSVTL